VTARVVLIPGPGEENYQDSAGTTPATSAGDVVGRVVSQGSDGFAVTQSTTANKPTLQQVTINGVTSWAWRVDGTDWLQGAFDDGATTQPFTTFVSAQLAAAAVNDGNNRQIFEGDDGVNRVIAGQASAPDPDVWRLESAGNRIVGSATDINWHTFVFVMNGASGEIFLSGVLDVSGNAGAGVIDGLTLGANFAGGAEWQGCILAALIFDADLSDADLNTVGQWYEKNYGIAWTDI
jgi:hypothetical protein